MGKSGVETLIRLVNQASYERWSKKRKQDFTWKRKMILTELVWFIR